ncbi:MAG: transcriptional regulator [bacterium]|nr:transcriptional regulator [bacterium]
MPLTRDFQETVQARALTDRAFREKLLQEGVECLLAGDIEAGKITLRDYINATIGFKKLGLMTDKPPKSLMRMFGPAGNPHARNIFEIIAHIQRHEGVQLEVSAIRQSHDTQQAQPSRSAASPTA